MKIDNFTTFRETLAKVLEACGSPEVAVELVGDTGCEGGAGFDALWNCWLAVECDLDDIDHDYWGSLVHDCVIELFSEIRNPMNFGPGDAPQVRLDVPELARKVETEFVKRLEAA